MFPTLVLQHSFFENGPDFWAFQELQRVYPANWTATEVRERLINYLNKELPEFIFFFTGAEHDELIVEVKGQMGMFPVFGIHEKYQFFNWSSFKSAMHDYFNILKSKKGESEKKYSAYLTPMSGSDSQQRRYQHLSIQGNKLILS